MAARGYLGKISAVVAINTGGVKPSLNAAAKDIDSWGKTVQSRLSGTSDSAKRAFNDIFTPLQRLQAAVKAANRQPLDLRVPNVRSFLDLARATEQIAKPLGNASKQLTGLSQGVQSELLPALVSAQKQASGLFDAISRGTKITERDFANTEARINRVVQAISRANEASQATRGLATGQELRFQNPEFLRSTGRAAQLQQQAAALSPEAISGGQISNLVGSQSRAAQEAERLRAALDRVIVTRRGDEQAARRAYTQQLAFLDQINDSLERQIRLEAQTGQSALNSREQAAMRLENQLADAARQRQESEQAALNRREQTALRLENQLADAARQRQDAEEQAFQAFIRRQQAARSLEERLAGGVNPPTPSERDDTARLINRERAALEAERQRPSDLTGNRDPRTRTLNQLQQSVGDLRNRVRGVGETLAGDVGPIVDGLTTRFQNLARAGVGFTAEQARRLAQEIAGVNAALNSRQALGQRFSESFGGAGRAGLALGVDERSLRAIGGEIEFVQGRLSALTQAVRGPTIAALEAFRVRAQQLFEGGALDTTEGRRELQLLREELIRTLSAAGGGSRRSLADALRRAGDVGRGGFDRLGLAIQQAAFAVEDFFSVTGGLDQRVRAAGNNISQLGFVLGGTQGLIVGISAAIGAQLVAALIRWSDAGRTSEDRTKALNAALERQKSIVDALAQSYEKVAEAIQDAGLSQRGRRDAEIRRQVEDIQRQQRQAREQRILGTDEGVASARASVARAERELAGATTAGQQVRAQLSLNEAREQQRREEQRALNQAGSAIGGAREAVISVLTDQINQETAAAFAGARAAAAAGGGAGAAGAFEAARRTEERNRQRIGALQGIGQSPQEALRALDERINQLVTSGASGDVILPLQQLRERLLVYTRQIEADNLSARISRGVLRIVDAMESAQSDVAQAFDGIRGASAIEDEIAAFGESLAQFQRFMSEAAQRGDVEQVQAFQEDINAIRAHIRALQDAASAVRLFGTALQRLSESVARDLSSLEQRAEEARRADIAQGTPRSGGARERADRDVREARRAQRQFEDERAAAVERFEERAMRNGDRRMRRIREIDAMLAAPMGGVGADGTRGGTAAERQAARDERRSLQAEVDAEVENDPAVRQARRNADAATRRAEMAAMADQGRELLLRPGQRARLDLDQRLRELDAALQSRIDEAIQAGRPQDIATIRNEDAEARQRLQEEAFRQQAPAIFGLADAVTNALLQGPSRAALQPTDISTVEGSRELTRLLRGDDAARDQANLVELQKEANRLLDLIANNPANIAN